jgi:hypothetical protein
MARASELVSQRSIRLLTQILLSEFYRRRGLPLSTLQQDSEGKRRHLTNVLAILLFA